MGTITKNIYGCFILLILLFPKMSIGQTESSSSINKSLPVLNGHYFIPNSIFPSPFITSFFKYGIGGGYSENIIPIYNNSGDLLKTISAENSYIITHFHAQIEATEWLAVWFRYLINSRIGTTAPTIITQGINSVTGFEFGWKLRLLKTKKSQLSGTFVINNSNTTSINFMQTIEDIVNNQDTITAPLNKQNPLYGIGGLKFAYSFNKTIGIEAFLNILYGESIINENKSAFIFTTGLLGSFNFNASHNIPVGFSLGFTSEKFSLSEDQNDENINSFMLKIAYTGIEEYNLGLEIVNVNTTAPLIYGVENSQYITATFVMVYYF